jgi:hypothetical protein
MLGNVILKNICVLVAPSIFAASKSDGLIPIIAAISKIVVFPNHIRKFIKAISALVHPTEVKKLIPFLAIPDEIKKPFTGPIFENNAKNS